MLCNTTIIRYLNKPTQSKTQLTQGVVNSFNTYYTPLVPRSALLTRLADELFLLRLMNSVTTSVSQCKIQTLLSLATNASTGKALFVTHSASEY